MGFDDLNVARAISPQIRRAGADRAGRLPALQLYKSGFCLSVSLSKHTVGAALTRKGEQPGIRNECNLP